MQAPILLGTLLQNRYRLIALLGQGGFGRTYLAEDQGRFNERCVLKEWMPTQSGTFSFTKSQELFQREAQVLYQLEHPQIPRFRALFEQDDRLFLVQDYVAGKTYRELLGERQRQGMVFSEPEARQLVQQLLPVLDYIHSQNMIHRDISPENIILRDSDRLPILIDFGVVKELATRLQFGGGATSATSVGKMGYAPSEQMQTGRAYPNSDLYALAVTAIVLLTGREPQDLFDDQKLVWHWQRWATVSPGLANILNRMLSQKPGDRYPAARDVAHALQGLPAPSAAAVANPPNSAQLSQMKTRAVANPRPISHSQYPAVSENPVIPHPHSRSWWENPWTFIPTGILVALVSGFGAWAIVNAFFNPTTPKAAVSPEATDSPIPIPTLTPRTPVALPTAGSVQHRQLDLLPDQLFADAGSVNTPLIYQFQAEKGQRLTVSVKGKNLRLTLLTPQQELVDPKADGVQDWQGTLPTTGEYLLRLYSTTGNETSYQLEMLLSNPVQPTPKAAPTSPAPEITIDGSSLNPSPNPIASPSPEDSPPATANTESSPSPVPTPNQLAYEISSLEMKPGRKKTKVSGQTSAQRIKRYLLSGEAGQVARIEATRGAVTLEIRDPSGQVVENGSGVVFWQEKLTSDGVYQIDVRADQPTDFSLEAQISLPKSDRDQ
jgi:serine/threonine-protein kinase